MNKLILSVLVSTTFASPIFSKMDLSSKVDWFKEFWATPKGKVAVVGGSVALAYLWHNHSKLSHHHDRLDDHNLVLNGNNNNGLANQVTGLHGLLHGDGNNHGLVHKVDALHQSTEGHRTTLHGNNNNGLIQQVNGHQQTIAVHNAVLNGNGHGNHGLVGQVNHLHTTIGQHHELFHGVAARDGAEARPGILEQIGGIPAQIGAAIAELVNQTNHDALAGRVTALEGRVDNHEGRITGIEEAIKSEGGVQTKITDYFARMSDAESARVQAETRRDEFERDRQANEGQRQEAEGRRNPAIVAMLSGWMQMIMAALGPVATQAMQAATSQIIQGAGSALVGQIVQDIEGGGQAGPANDGDEDTGGAARANDGDAPADARSDDNDDHAERHEGVA